MILPLAITAQHLSCVNVTRRWSVFIILMQLLDREKKRYCGLKCAAVDTQPLQAPGMTVRGNITMFAGLTKTWINRRLWACPTRFLIRGRNRVYCQPQRPEGEGTLRNGEVITGNIKSDGFRDMPWHIYALRESWLMMCGIWTISLMALIIF